MTRAADPGIIFRPLSPDDVIAWAELVNHLLREDSRGTSIRPQDLAHEFHTEGFDPLTDSWTAWKNDRLLGWVNVFAPKDLDQQGWARAVLHGGVHAQHRRSRVGTALMDAMEARAGQLLAQRHPHTRRARLIADAGRLSSSARLMLQARGYADHQFVNVMERDTAAPHAQAGPPEGLVIRSPDTRDLEPLRTAHQLAFAGPDAASEAAWREDWTGEWARLEQSTIVLNRAGVPLAYVLATSWADRELHLNWIGTVPEHRGQGLALLALTHTIEQAHRSQDYDLITLTVDSAHPNNAQQLYERAGFHRAQQTVVMSKTLTGGSPQ